MRANGGGEDRDRKKRERDSREDGEGAHAGEDEAPARKINDLQSSTDKRKTGFISRLRERGDAVRASSRAEAWERVDQTMQEAITECAEPDASGGCAPMEGVEDMFRCNRGPCQNPTQQLPLGGFRMLTPRPNQVDGRHCSRAPRDQARHLCARGQARRLREHGAHAGGAAGTEPGGRHRANGPAAGA